MAIRFSCPACQQPLEIDDSWAGQSVACPYCRRVVTAPQASTWPGSGVPMASPGRPVDPSVPVPGLGPPPAPGYGTPPAPGFAPPPPPMGYGPQAGYGPRPGSSAGWALGLTILGAVMLIGVGMAWAVFVSQAAQAALGASPTQEQIQKFAEDSMRQGNFPHRQGLAMAAVAAMLASIGGLVLAVRSLVRQESGRGMAITACVLGGIFLFCQVMMMMMFLAARSAT